MEKAAFITMLVIAALTRASAAVAPTEPTYDAAYGPHPRHKMYFWKCASETPAGVMLEIHDGGWREGQRAAVMNPREHRDDYSYCTIDYPLIGDADGDRLPAVLHSAARAVQFLRSKAKEWNIDPDRILAKGTGAGGATALWLAFHDDLADPGSDDPVLRQSSRIAGAFGRGAPTTLDAPLLQKRIGPAVIKHRMLWDAVGAENPEDLIANWDRYKQLALECSPLSHVDKDDPPVYIEYDGGEPTPAENEQQAIGHSLLGTMLKEKCDEAGATCYLRILSKEDRETPNNRRLQARVEAGNPVFDSFDFMKRILCPRKHVAYTADEADPYPNVGYNQRYRPQFHFTSKKNWINDPNGLVYYEGEYHLFFQHNPRGWKWGSMTWGHAVSKDMIHWKQIQHAIYPYDRGLIFSGSAAVDESNTSGFGKKGSGAEKPLVAAYTHTIKPACVQSIAYSTDRGRLWTLYEGNPVVPNQGLMAYERDPKIFWHEPTKKWVMALFASGDRGTPCKVRFFNSDDLKNWVKTSDTTFKHFHECPDMVELPVDGDDNDKKWIIYDAGLNYYIGTFDGKTFTVEESPPRGENGRNVKAGQTFNNMPDGRAVQIVWMVGAHIPEGGGDQALTFPVRLTLHKTEDGIRLYRWPIKEIELLYTKKHEIGQIDLKAGANALADIKGELLDIYAELEMGSAEKVVFNLRGSTVTYDGKTLISEPKLPKPQPAGRRGKIEMKPRDGKVNIRILVDRASVEAFGNDGRVSLTDFAVHEPENLDLSLTAEGGDAMVYKIVVNELRSAWE